MAALARATELGPGHTITHDPLPTRGLPHYHVVAPTGRLTFRRIRGHFFYGRRLPIKERGLSYERERARERQPYSEEPTREEIERWLQETLPAWVVALLTAAAIAAIVACFASGVCEAAAIIGAAGAAAGAVIILVLQEAGVDVQGGSETPPQA